MAASSSFSSAPGSPAPAFSLRTARADLAFRQAFASAAGISSQESLERTFDQAEADVRSNPPPQPPRRPETEDLRGSFSDRLSRGAFTDEVGYCYSMRIASKLTAAARLRFPAPQASEEPRAASLPAVSLSMPRTPEEVCAAESAGLSAGGAGEPQAMPAMMPAMMPAALFDFGAETVDDLDVKAGVWLPLISRLRRLRSLRVALVDAVPWRRDMLAGAPSSLRDLDIRLECCTRVEEDLLLPTTLTSLRIRSHAPQKVLPFAAAVARQGLRLERLALGFSILGAPEKAALGDAWAALIDAARDSLHAVTLGGGCLFRGQAPGEDELLRAPLRSATRLPLLEEFEAEGVVLGSEEDAEELLPLQPTLRRLRLDVLRGARFLPPVLRARLPPLEKLVLRAVERSDEGLDPRAIARAVAHALSRSRNLQVLCLRFPFPLGGAGEPQAMPGAAFPALTLQDLWELEAVLRPHRRTLRMLSLGRIDTRGGGGAAAWASEAALAQVVGAFARRWDALHFLELVRLVEPDDLSTCGQRDGARREAHPSAAILAAIPGASPLRSVLTSARTSESRAPRGLLLPMGLAPAHPLIRAQLERWAREARQLDEAARAWSVVAAGILAAQEKRLLGEVVGFVCGDFGRLPLRPLRLISRLLERRGPAPPCPSELTLS